MAPTAFAPSMDGYRLTPMLQQYVAAKKAHPDAVLMFRMGDFFELFFDDAKLAAQELDLTLTSRDKGERPIPMAGVPHHAIEGYIAKLVARGHTVALCDQVEDAKQAQGLVRREITRIITPGTVSDLDALEPSRSSYLACVLAVDAAEPTWAVACLDLLAGELVCTSGAPSSVLDELQRLAVREVLAPAALLPRLNEALRQRQVAVRADAGPASDALEPPKKAQAIPGAPKGAVAEALARAVQRVQHYAAATQRRALGHLIAPRYYALNDYLIMDEATRQSLELTATSFEGRPQGSLFAHLNRTKTSMGARLLRHWLLLPLRDLTRIAQRADGVGALGAHRLMRQRLQEALAPIKDLERLAGRVALGRATPRDVQALSQSLLALPQVRAAVEQVAKDDGRLAAVARQWHGADLLEALSAHLSGALVDEPPVSTAEGGIFAKGFDAALDDLIDLATDSKAYVARFEQQQRQRTGISSLKVRYNRVFGYYIEVSRLASAQVPDDYVRRQTLANAERYVTEELKTFEQRVLEADGRRRALEAELFTGVVAELCGVLGPLRTLVRLVAQADALASLGEVADKHRYVRPTMVEGATVDLKAARHATLEVMLPGGEPFVPNDVLLDGASRSLMLVTGPNMAGKSTLMRQVALCAIMAQMGGFVPAASATLGVCDRLYTRVGAQDNLGRGQSTFMVEMMETANILHHATAQSLVLLDEIGRGTSTFDGLSIAWAVAEHLHDVNGCRTLFATHYHELTELTRSHRRAVAMQVTAKEINGEVVFLRQLQEGGADRSYGIEVARLARMPESVLRRAKEVLTVLEASSDGAPAPVAASGLPAPAQLPQRRQLGLFGAPAPAPQDGAAAAPAPLPGPGADILEQLRRTQVNHLTPMQALKLVHSWHERLGAARQGACASAAGRRRRGRPNAQEAGPEPKLC